MNENPLSQQRSGSSSGWFDRLASSLVLIILAIVSIGFGAAIVSWWLARTTVHTIKIGAGARQGESFIISEAFETVVERYHPNIQIEVVETGGTSDNLQQLEANQVQLATGQADVPAGINATTVAVLYPDLFQLLVRSEANIEQFSDLKNKRIALPTSGGQYRSFLALADHFGLRDRDFTFVGETESQANVAFLRNEADAAFRVRAPGNASIALLVENENVSLIPIPQAAAMQFKFPAFDPVVIPEGTYKGQPPIPTRDLPSVEVQRLLLARKTVPEDVIRNMTSVLFERRQEIAEAIPEHLSTAKPLLAKVREPGGGGLRNPIHPGAQEYYGQDDPSFIQENADYVALILTVGVLAASWIWELKNLIERRQKNKADGYTEKVMRLMNDSRESDLGQTERNRQELLDILAEAVTDLDRDRISEESFQSFRVVWQIAMDVVRERQDSLRRSPGTLSEVSVG